MSVIRTGARGAPLAVLLIVAVQLGACATAGSTASQTMASLTKARDWSPTVDLQGKNQTVYANDLAECRAYADANPDADAQKAAKNGAMKYGLGTAALVGVAAVASGGLALLPLVAGNALVTGGVGAAVGGSGAKASAEIKYQSMVNSCLAGRGYSIVS